MDNFWCWFYRRYILVFCVLLLAIILGAFLAPLLAHAHFDMGAQVIYTLYRITCHQLAYRSWFLFGEQAYYPLRIAGVPNVEPFEKVSGIASYDLRAAQDFIGNELIGYKTTLCQRDIAIGFGFVISGVGFALSRRRWKPISILLWIVLGVLPMLVDGLVQWGGGDVFGWQLRNAYESTPLMRTATGILFGLCSGLFIFPKLDVALRITRNNHNCREP